MSELKRLQTIRKELTALVQYHKDTAAAAYGSDDEPFDNSDEWAEYRYEVGRKESMEAALLLVEKHINQVVGDAHLELAHRSGF